MAVARYRMICLLLLKVEERRKVQLPRINTSLYYANTFIFQIKGFTVSVMRKEMRYIILNGLVSLMKAQQDVSLRNYKHFVSILSICSLSATAVVRRFDGILGCQNVAGS